MCFCLFSEAIRCISNKGDVELIFATETQKNGNLRVKP